MHVNIAYCTCICAGMCVRRNIFAAKHISLMPSVTNCAANVRRRAANEVCAFFIIIAIAVARASNCVVCASAGGEYTWRCVNKNAHRTPYMHTLTHTYKHT